MAYVKSRIFLHTFSHAAVLISATFGVIEPIDSNSAGSIISSSLMVCILAATKELSYLKKTPKAWTLSLIYFSIIIALLSAKLIIVYFT
jgi:hypothetical protein